jgi:hypothetical protein
MGERVSAPLADSESDGEHTEDHGNGRHENRPQGLGLNGFRLHIYGPFVGNLRLFLAASAHEK